MRCKNIFHGIAANDNEIRDLAFLDAAVVFVFTPRLSHVEACGLNSLKRRQPRVDYKLKLGVDAVTREHVIGIGAGMDLSSGGDKPSGEILDHLIAGEQSGALLG